MKKLIMAAVLILAFTSAAFAGATIDPTSADWDDTNGRAGALTFTINSTDTITAVRFVSDGGDVNVDFSAKESEFAFTTPTLTIYRTPLTKVPNGKYTMKAATANTVSQDVTVTDHKINGTLSVDLHGVYSLTFKNENTSIEFKPSEFTFNKGTKELTIKPEALVSVDAGEYTMTAVECVEATVTISGNTEKGGGSGGGGSSSGGGGSSSGGGCNVGLGALAVLFAVSLFRRRK